ncbi:MAG: SdrD B-like domain-containing protein [Thiolinea sp.]
MSIPGGSILVGAPGSSEPFENYAIEFTATAASSTISFVNYGHLSMDGYNWWDWCDSAKHEWCSIGGTQNETTTNELIIDDVAVVEAACDTGTLSGTVYTDSNGNDLFDSASEAGINSVTVTLLNNADGSTVATTTTAVNGLYTFNGLDASLTYQVVVDTADSDLSGQTLGTVNPLSGITVTAGNTTTDQNFGFDPVPVSNLVCTGGSTLVSLDWSSATWPVGDTSRTFSNVAGSGHNLTVNWRTVDATFAAGRPSIANNAVECPSATGSYCLDSNATVTTLTAEHAVELIFSPAVSGLDAIVGDLQDKRDGGASVNEIVEGVSLTKGSGAGLTVLPGANITTGSVRTDYAATTRDDGDANAIRYLWSNTAVSNVEFTVRNDNPGPGVYGNALSFNLGGISFCANSSGTGATVSGNVFEDVNYGGGVGRALGTVGTMGVNGARVELYNSAGAFVESTTTAAGGSYSFSSQPNGNYYVRVVNATVRSTRPGANGTERGVQTFRSNGVTAVTNEVGGRKPASIDAVANTTSQTLNTSTFLLSGGGQAQSVQPVTISGGNLSGVNFGFNFDTIVNTNNAGQGSLRQFIINSNLLDNAGLAQVGQTAGDEASIFMIPATQLTAGVARIAVQSQLPVITDDHTVITGATQTTYIGDTNTGTVGVNRSVGIASCGMSVTVVERPEIEIYEAAGILNTSGISFTTGADYGAVQGVAIYGFGQPDYPDTYTYADILVSNSDNVLIENTVIGATASGADPGRTAGTLSNTIRISQTSMGATIRNNYLGFFYRDGVYIESFASNNVVRNNQFVMQGAWEAVLGEATTAAVSVEQSSNNLVEGNFVTGGGYEAFELKHESPGNIWRCNTVDELTIDGYRGNGFFIFLGHSGSLIEHNVVTRTDTAVLGSSHNGAGSNNTISQNSFYANDNLGIDLSLNKLGDGVTLNDANDSDTGPNAFLNFPIIDRISLAGTDIVLQGCAPAGATVEVFESDVSAGGAALPGDNRLGRSQDYGEGQTYLFSFVEGGSSDTNAAACSLPVDVDGNNFSGMQAFNVTLPLPAGLEQEDKLTATATVSGVGTSEFSPEYVYNTACSLVVTTTADTNNTDNNTGSLRDAIECANSRPGPDTITFDMPTSEAGYNATTGVWSLIPLSPLPSITDVGTTIDATTQTGASCGNLWAGTGRSLKVQLDGNGLATSSVGLNVEGDGFALRGLSIVRFLQYGLRTMATADSATLTCNHIGVAADGMTAGSNSTGLSLSGSRAMIGGTTSGDGNIIAGNSTGGGIVFNATAGDAGMVFNNFIGVGGNGSTAIANGIGIWSIRSPNLIIGGTTPGQANLISGNPNAGITFIGPNTDGSKVQGNLIGTSKTGLTPVPNGAGINFGNFAAGITVGGSGVGTGNVLAGNTGAGIATGSDVGRDALNNVIANNLIGIGKGGIIPVPNQDGITLFEVNDFRIEANRIAYNTRWGVMLQAGADRVILSRNQIYDNAQTGIDLQGHNGSVATSVNVTVNDAGDADDGANNLLNFPVLNRVVASGTELLLSGCAPAGSTVELFEADVSPGGHANPGDNRFGLGHDYGEGETYLGSLVEGGAADIDQGACSIPGFDGNDNSGMQAFQFTLPQPGSVAPGDYLTATATLAAAGTSEFGPVIKASDLPPVVGGGSCLASGGTDILFIVDNSGSITPAEYADFSQTIEAVGNRFLVDNPQHRIAVAHFGGPTDSLVSGGQYVYIERDFSSVPMVAPIRQFGTNGAYNTDWWADHLAGAVEQMRYALDGDPATTSNLIISPIREASRNAGAPLQIVLMTDAVRYLDLVPDDISMLIDPAGSGAEPNDGSNYTVFNQLKAEGVSFSVVSFNPLLEAIQASAAIASVGGNYNGVVDANPMDPEGNQTTPRRFISVTSGFQLTAGQMDELVNNVGICGSSISGVLFEDQAYGGGPGRPFGEPGTVGVSGATVEVYDHTGAYVAAVKAGLGGIYRLPSLPDDDYYVRVVNSSVVSGRSGSNGSELGIQTFRTDGVTPVTNEIGGRNPVVTDAEANSGGSQLNVTTFRFVGGSLDGQQAQSVQPVTLGGNNLNNVSFGFNFNTIVNANADGQGSLRQFAYNSNLLDSSGITQQLPAAVAGDYSSGDTVAVFMIPVAQLVSGAAVIPLNGSLYLDQARTVIDGRVQAANQGSGEIILQGDGSGVINGVHYGTAAGGSVLRDLKVLNMGGSGLLIDGSGTAGSSSSGVSVTAVEISGHGHYGVLLQNGAIHNQLIANQITDNGWAGIGNDAAAANTFSRNQITRNGALGIDLGLDGVTLNSSTDVWLNYPEVGAGSTISSNGSAIVSYDFDLDVPANSYGYRVEFFMNTLVDASDHGEGETYLGAVELTHSGAGLLNFKGTLNADQPVPENANIAVTLTEKTGTNTLGATSEFSGVRNGKLSVCTSLLADPTAPLPTVTIDENSTEVSFLEAKDANGDPVTYVISGGADSLAFVIHPVPPGALFDCLTVELIRDDGIGTRNLRADPVPVAGNYEQPADANQDNIYELDITATDINGLEVTRSLSFKILDVNEAPLITSATRVEFTEQQTGTVLDVESWDPDSGDVEQQGLGYSLAGGVDQDRFSIDPLTGELHFLEAPVYRQPADSNGDNDYELVVRVMDDQGLADSKALKVSVIADPANTLLSLQARALLQGPYDAGSGLMHDDLRTQGVLPTAQPFLDLFGYTGTETLHPDLLATEGADAPVDWMLLELRAATSPAQVLAAKAVLVQSDGDLMDAGTGSTSLDFIGLEAGDYYVSLRHRNHLGIMSAVPWSLNTNGITMLDFSLTETAVQGGEPARLSTGGVALLWSGDSNHNQQLVALGVGNDANPMLQKVLMHAENLYFNTNYRLPGYETTDLNLDGFTVFMGPGNDANLLLGNVLINPANSSFSANYVVSGSLWGEVP